jgi:nucleotide-binding universal stress UspA family protein
MKKIIIPTDFSANAYNAIAYALQLFAAENCIFYLIHAYSPPMPEPTNTMTSASTAKKLIDMAHKSAQQGLDEVLEQIQTSFMNTKHSFETIPSFGFLTDVIDEVGKEKDVDLVVMGTKGASGLKEIVIGSNTSRIIGGSNYPLIVVPENAIYDTLKEVAFMTDYDYYFERAEINPLVELVKQSGAELHITHVLIKGDKPSQEKELVREHLEDILKPVTPKYHFLTEKSVENAIHLFVQSRNTDLLCMVTKKHSFLQRLFKKPTTKEVSFHTKIPMLVLRRGK